MKLDEMSAEECLAQAKIFESDGKLSAAAQLMQIAVAKAPGEGIYRQERLRLQRLIRGESDTPTGPPPSDAKLLSLLAYGDWKAARPLLKELCKANPDSALYRAQMASVVGHLKGPEDGLPWANKALQIDASSLEAHVIRHHLLKEAKATEGLGELAQGIQALVGEERAKLAQARRNLGLAKDAGTGEASNRGRRIRFAAMGAVAAGLGALGVLLAPEAPEVLEVMDASAYAAVAPVVKVESQPGSKSVFLTVDKLGWERLGEEGQAEAMSGLGEVLLDEGRSQAMLLENGSMPLGVVQAGAMETAPEGGE